MSYDVYERHSLPPCAVQIVQRTGPRSEQQDVCGFAFDNNAVPFVVLADGAGGHDGGREAALAAVRACCDVHPTTARFEHALDQAMARLRLTYPSAVTTVVAAQFDVPRHCLHVWWIGDSRAYALRMIHGKLHLTPLTADNNVAWVRWAEQRKANPAADYDVYGSNRLTAWVSTQTQGNITLQSAMVAHDSIVGVVLMSDGAYDALGLPPLTPGHGFYDPVPPFANQPCVPCDMTQLRTAHLADNASAIALWVPA